MKPLTDAELLSIHGGWDWDDFLRGVALGAGIAALTLATGGGALATEAAILAWTGVGAGVVSLYV